MIIGQCSGQLSIHTGVPEPEMGIRYWLHMLMMKRKFITTGLRQPESRVR